MANTSKQQILAIHSPRGEEYNAATEQQQNIVGQRIAQARNQVGISLAKFSTLLEDYGVFVKAAAISKWEVGKAVPNAYQLMAVAHPLRSRCILNHSRRPAPKYPRSGPSRSQYGRQ